MSSCNSNPCAPVNPCECAETADIREQGPPGSRGLPGGIPVFQIGTTVSGPVPMVTITQVNPLLYTLDFVIPSVGTDLPNTWLATQTFAVPAVFSDGFSALGTSTFVNLTVSGDFQAAASIFTGLSTFNGNTVFNGTNDFQGDTTFLNTTIAGTFKLTSLIALPANTAILGELVVLADGTIRFSPTTTSANIISGFTALAAVIPFNQSETAIAFNQPFVIPAGGPSSVRIDAILGALPSGANPPADLSQYLLNARLDDAVTGTVVASAIFSNYEAEALLVGNFLVAAGAHTMYYTIQGIGLGSSSVALRNMGGRIEF